MRRDPEAQLRESLRLFLEKKNLVDTSKCHFGGDNDERADIELLLNRALWPVGMPAKILLEAKSNHSTDSANTINKLFGQLLKETGKASRNKWASSSFCLGILVPSDGGEWETRNGKKKKAGSGLDYYRVGFSRIPRHIFDAFGGLVNARYVFAYSESLQCLSVFTWSGFRNSEEPFLKFSAINAPAK